MKKNYLRPETTEHRAQLVLCQWPFSEEPPWGYAYPQAKEKNENEYENEDGKEWGSLW